MLDSTIPVSPKVAIVMALDEGPKHILIDKDKADVIYVEPYHIRSNTRAYLNEYDTDTKVNLIRNHREVLYDRIDLTHLIEDIAVLTYDANDQLCHVIHTASTDKTTHNLDVNTFCDLLDKEYDIPVLPTDFAGAILNPVTAKSTALGEVYRTMNCTVTDVEIAYTGGTITHLDDVSNGVVNRPGFVLTKEWNNGETLSILPNENIDKTGWSIVVGFNNDVGYTTGLHTSLTLSQDSKSEAWQVTYKGDVVAVFTGGPEAGVAIKIGNRELTIETLGGTTTSVTIPAPNLHHNRGVMRILAYTSNPYPSLYKLGFDASTVEVIEAGDLIINDKDYAPVYNLVHSDFRSNAVVNNIKYPVSVSPYKASNYLERAQDIFKPVEDETTGSISVFLKPEGFNPQEVTFLLGYSDGTLPKQTVVSVLITITDTRNVNNKLYVKSIPLSNGTTLVGTGPSLSALVYSTIEQSTDSDMFSTLITAGAIDVTEHELILGQYTTGEEINTNDISIYKVDIEVKVKQGMRLPNIDVVKILPSNSDV